MTPGVLHACAAAAGMIARDSTLLNNHRRSRTHTTCAQRVRSQNTQRARNSMHPHRAAGPCTCTGSAARAHTSIILVVRAHFATPRARIMDLGSRRSAARFARALALASHAHATSSTARAAHGPIHGHGDLCAIAMKKKK